MDLSTLVPPFNKLKGGFTEIPPGYDAPDAVAFPGQVVGDGCVFPAPSTISHGARTIADQLDAVKRPNRKTHAASWRMYAQSMGGDPVRDFGTPDPTGGTTCATHPLVASTTPIVPRPAPSTPPVTILSSTSIR